jgi:hypothetical protein
MAITAPRDPEKGDDNLAWAREVTSILRRLIPRESDDIWPSVGTTGTSYQMRRKGGKNGGGSGTKSGPFNVTMTGNPDPEGDSVGWVKVALNSWLMQSETPDDKVTITGLDFPLQLDLEDSPRQNIWMEIDIQGRYGEEPTPILAEIKSGADWNGDEGDFFPEPIRFGTDDGTFSGSEDEAPINNRQTHIYVPIAYTYDLESSEALFGGSDPPGIMLTEEVRLVQVLEAHQLIFETCHKGHIVLLTRDYRAPIPPPE